MIRHSKFPGIELAINLAETTALTYGTKKAAEYSNKIVKYIKNKINPPDETRNLSLLGKKCNDGSGEYKMIGEFIMCVDSAPN